MEANVRRGPTTWRPLTAEEAGGDSARPTSPLGFPQHPEEHCPEHSILLAVDLQLGEGAGLGHVAEACREQLQPSSLSGFRTGESGAYGGEGGRMIAAISIGIIIIIAVIIAALAIIYFILKGSPR